MNEKRYDFARFYEPGPRNSTLYVLRIYIYVYTLQGGGIVREL